VVSLPGGAFTGAGAGVKTNLVFFTRGRKTERIWYYDLSHIKVGKKTPLTLQHFDEFFRLLPLRGDDEADTPHSWTVDFAGAKSAAFEQAAPFRREAEIQRATVLNLKDQIKPARTAKNDAEVERLQLAIADAEKLARDASAKAQAIEDAVFDIKAQNPNEQKVVDTRTPAQLLRAIHEKGLEVDAALKALQALVGPVSADVLAIGDSTHVLAAAK
jgi:type I restriction enzyme M protein